MSREAHVRFSEGVGVKLPRATRPSESLRRSLRGAVRHRDSFSTMSAAFIRRSAIARRWPSGAKDGAQGLLGMWTTQPR